MPGLNEPLLIQSDDDNEIMCTIESYADVPLAVEFLVGTVETASSKKDARSFSGASAGDHAIALAKNCN